MSVKLLVATAKNGGDFVGGSHRVVASDEEEDTAAVFDNK